MAIRESNHGPEEPGSYIQVGAPTQPNPPGGSGAPSPEYKENHCGLCSFIWQGTRWSTSTKVFMMSVASGPRISSLSHLSPVYLLNIFPIRCRCTSFILCKSSIVQNTRVFSALRLIDRIFSNLSLSLSLQLERGSLSSAKEPIKSTPHSKSVVSHSLPGL